ncbi:unnamed protein product, partial [Phaeothamnion confervicola]
TAVRATDGDPYTLWTAASAAGQYLTLDLGSEQPVTAVRMT